MNGTPSFPTTGFGHKQLQKTGAVTKRDCSRERVAKLCFTTRSRFVRSRLMPKSSAFRHSRIYRRKIRGACPRIFRIFIEIGLRPKSLIDFCNSLTGAVTKRDCSRCYYYLRLFQQDKSVFVGTDTVYEKHILVQAAGAADEACFFVRPCGFDANAGRIVCMAVPKSDDGLLFVGFA